MPIRLRLTFWYCLIFGIIMSVVITVIYYSHKQAHYKDVDLMITNISLHVQEEISQQFKEGKSLEQINLAVDSLSVNEFAVRVKSQTGEVIKTNSHAFFKDHQLTDDKKLNDSGLQTITDDEGVRIRVNITPISQDGVKVGYIETLYSLKSLDDKIHRFKWLVISLTVFGMALASIGGWLLAKKTLLRVDLIGKTAKAIAASQDFKQRVMYSGPSDELGQLTETFNQMLESLEKSYTNQKRFLSDASHELRAPLTTIRGNLDILHKMKNITDLEKEEILSDIRNESIRMSKLVDDLLSLARADAGQVVHKDIIDLSAIAEEVLAEIESWEKIINIKAKIKDDIWIWGDRNSIKQVIIILLDNAINYTPSNGSIFMTVTEENKHAAIHIKDTGIGIQSEELSYIFDRFYRTEGARIYSPEGTGLGLSIAKWITDEHQGSIIIKSNSGEGTEFIVYLPLIH